MKPHLTLECTDQTIRVEKQARRGAKLRRVHQVRKQWSTEGLRRLSTLSERGD